MNQKCFRPGQHAVKLYMVHFGIRIAINFKGVLLLFRRL
jgi:hypothetical protein